MKILTTSPNYDEVTGYLFAYTQQLIKSTKVKINCLKRPKLTRKTLTKIINKQNPELLLLNGHGDATTIFGDKIDGLEEPLIIEGVNNDLLEGKLVYARACSAGKSLGKTCSDCFIGYKNLFQWWTDSTWHGNPIKDNTARLFLEPTNKLAEALIDGKKAQDAANIFIAESKKNILSLLRKEESGTLASVMLLWSNIEAQVVIGDNQMRLSA